MDQLSSGPVGRLWEVTSERLCVPGAAEAFCATVLPVLDAVPRDRGRLIVVDRRRGVLRALTLSDSTGTWIAPTAVMEDIGEALRELTWSSLRGPLPFQVLLGRFTGRHPRPPGMAGAAGMVARISLLEGGRAARPEVTEVARRHLEEVVLPSPGCVGAFLLVDPDRRSALAATVWADRESAAATVASGEAVLDAAVAAAGADLVDAATHDVLVYDEPTAKSLA